MQKRRNAFGYNLQGSFITGYAGVVAPPFERAYLGGENDVRGFDFRTISPIAYLPSVQTVNLRNGDGSFVPANYHFPVQVSSTGACVSTTTGLFLAGGANWQKRMSPRSIPPATPPPLPNHGLHRASVARSHSRRGHAARELGSPISGGVLGARRESTQSDSAWYDARPGRSPVGASYREQPGSFPYVESTPQYTPYTGNWRIRPGDPASVRKPFPPMAADFSRD